MNSLRDIKLSKAKFKLREINNNDFNDLFEIYSNKELLYYTDSEVHKSIEDTKQFVARIKKENELKISVYFVIYSMELNKVIGIVGIYNINLKHSFASIICVLRRDFWRKGIVISALKALIEYSFIELSLNRLEAQVCEDNIASAELFRKLNFVEEGILRKNFVIDEKFESSIMFSILNEE